MENALAGRARICVRHVSELPCVDEMGLIGNVDTFVASCERAFGDEQLGLLNSSDGSAAVFRHADLKAIAENPVAGNTPPNALIRWTLQHPDTANHADSENVGGSLARWVTNQIFTANPPLHRPERMIVVRQFGPKVVSALRPTALAIADEIVNSLADDSRIDLIQHLTSQLAIRLSGGMLGMTQSEQGRMAEAVHDMSQLFLLAPTFEQFKSADDGAAKLIDVMCEAADRQMAAPGDNLVKTFAAELAMLDHQTDLDRTGMVPENVGVMLAANIFDAAHTTSVLSASVIYFLLENPETMERVRLDHSLVSAAVSEGIRLAPPLATSPRFALADIEYGNVLIPEGTIILMLWEVGNRDPAVFENPHKFDLDRKSARELTFGGGAHLCPGRHLSRMMAEIVVETMVSPAIELSLASDEQLWVRDSILRHLRALPVQVRRLAAA